MNISELILVLKTERILGRTPNGRAINEYAVRALDSAISDEKNYHIDIVKCMGCGFIISSLLVEDGCPNCGSIDLTENIDESVVKNQKT